LATAAPGWTASTAVFLAALGLPAVAEAGLTTAVLLAANGVVVAGLAAATALVRAGTALAFAVAGALAGSAGAVIPKAAFDAAVAWLRTPSIFAFVFWIICGFCAEATPAASMQTRIVIARFIVSPYRFTGVTGDFPGIPGVPATAGCKSWLKYVVVTQVATTLSFGAYW